MEQPTTAPPITEQTVREIAHLARIALDEEQASHHLLDLQRIISLVDQMNSVDTDGVAPLSSPLDAVQRLRDDVITEHNQREQLQINAPTTADGLYLVPQVIE